MRQADVAALGIIALSARSGRRQLVGPREEATFRAFNNLPDKLHPPVWTIMQLGSLAGGLAVGLADYQRTRRVDAAVRAVAVWGGVKLIKRSIGGRGRPAQHLSDVVVRGQAQHGRGWPSGHAAVSLASALSRRGPARTALVTFAGVAGLARMYVGAHLPGDIVAGWAIGYLATRRPVRQDR